MNEITGKNNKDIFVMYRYVPFVILTVLIPLAKYRFRVYLNEEMRRMLLNTQWYDDYYALIKVLLLYAAVIMMFPAIMLKKNKDRKIPGVLYFLVPYCICILLSVIFSGYKTTAWFGIVDMYEGGLTQLCYCFILFFSYFLFSGTEEMIKILRITLAASILVTVMGIFEYTGIIPSEEPFTISSTIGNSNYVGTYGAVLLPLSIALVLTETSRAKKIAYALLFFGSAFFLLTASMSRAGYFAALITVPGFFILLYAAAKDRIKQAAALVFYGICIFALMNSYSGGLLWDEIQSMNPFRQNQDEDRLVFRDIKLDDASAEIETNHWFIRVENNGDGFRFYNENSEEIRFRKDGNVLEFTDEPYSGITGYEDETSEVKWLMLEAGGKDIELVLVDGKMKVVGYNGQITDIVPVESFGFKGKETFASGRGYIWSRAIPLLKNAVFIGYGPDTFAFVFPQNDIVGKLNYGAIWVIIGKPHNWYLQIALGSGIISLICLMSVIAWYIAKTLALILRSNCKEYNHAKIGPAIEESKKQKIISSGILMSVFAYLAAGLFNDSFIAVSPIFWMLLGFGISLLQNKSGNKKSSHPL